jgi:hypothetical protein
MEAERAMKKLRKYLINRFLPAWCREELLEENRKLRERVDRQAAEIDRLKAYIGGMTDALRLQPRIIVNGGDRQ